MTETTSQHRNTVDGELVPAATPAVTPAVRRRLGLPRTRVGELWVMLVTSAFVLLLLLIFILQNGQRAQVNVLGAHGSLPMGVALLLAATFGVLLVTLPAALRIAQLRLLISRRRDEKAP